MLTEKAIADLAKVSGLAVDVLTNAINKEEKVDDLSISIEKTFSSDEWERFESTLDKEKKRKYDDGKEVGENQLIRDMKVDLGLDFDGKGKETFLEKYKEKILVDADKNPDKRVSELEGDLKKLKEVTLKEEIEKREKAEKALGQFALNKQIDAFIPSNLPAGLSVDDARMILKNNLEFTTDEDGKEVVKKGGEVLKSDKLREPLSYKEAISDFVVDRKWIGGKGGREDKDKGGGGSADTSKFRKMSEFEEYFKEKGINEMSSEARVIIGEAEKDAKEAKEEIDYDN